MPERATVAEPEREVSSGHSSCQYGAKGQRDRRVSLLMIGEGPSQMYALA